MTLQKTINKLTNVQPLMKDLATHVRVRVAAALLAEVKRRVQFTGVNARGAKFKGYSTRPALLGYSEYPLNKKAYSRLKSQMKKINKAAEKTGGESYGGWVTIDNHALMVVPGGYKAIRNAAGYQIAFKDFTVTNAMWRGVKVIGNPVIQGTKLTFSYGATDTLTAQKVSGHNKREGINILEPTAKELEAVQAEMVLFLKDAINKMFNAR